MIRLHNMRKSTCHHCKSHKKHRLIHHIEYNFTVHQFGHHSWRQNRWRALRQIINAHLSPGCILHFFPFFSLIEQARCDADVCWLFLTSKSIHESVFSHCDQSAPFTQFTEAKKLLTNFPCQGFMQPNQWEAKLIHGKRKSF